MSRSAAFVKLLLGIFKDIVVVASAKSLVGSNDDISLFTLFFGDIGTPVEELLTGMGSMLQNAVDSRLELIEVRLCTFKRLPCFFQLG